MTVTPLKQISTWLRSMNRERYRGELAQAIYDLMQSQKVKRIHLAKLLDVDKSRITQILSGAENLGADTLADILLVLGRTPHLVMGTDFGSVRLAVDEGNASDIVSTTTTTVTRTVPNTQEQLYGKAIQDIADRYTVTGFRGTADRGRDSVWEPSRPADRFLRQSADRQAV